MTQCDIEPSTSNFLKKFSTLPSVKEFLSKSDLSVLDIGCRVPIELCVLYHDFKFKKLRGVELLCEKDAVKAILKESESENLQLKTIYEVYKNEKFFRFEEQDIVEGKTYLTQSDFYNIFQIEYCTDAEYYLSKIEKGVFFNLIILSDFLHLITDNSRREYIFNKVISLLKKQGLLYVKVNHENNSTAKRRGHYTFNEESFYNLIKDFNEIISCKKIDKDSTEIISMAYLGIKG